MQGHSPLTASVVKARLQQLADPVQAGFKAHAGEMPRTMLRYAIERFPEQTRRRYLDVR